MRFTPHADSCAGPLPQKVSTHGADDTGSREQFINAMAEFKTSRPIGHIVAGAKAPRITKMMNDVLIGLSYSKPSQYAGHPLAADASKS